MITFLLACSDYAFDEHADKSGDTAHAPPSDTASGADSDLPTEEICDGLDNDADGETDEGFDTNGNGVADCEETEAYCTPFDDFSGWAYTGEGEWHVENGLLTEGRNGLYAAIAYAGDLGLAANFSIQFDTAWGGNDNDLTGIVWAVNGEAAYAVRWDDPQGDYGRYSPIGGMDVSRCDSSGCTVLIADSSADLFWPADMSFVTWGVNVAGSSVEVVVNGNRVLQGDVPELANSGPHVVGVYSNDNDGGVWFDNFCVWTSE
jgi:hypothetical protein